ncbi:hypothetical protein DYY66_1871 [Candidatus Nitrosotalea sp. FS]|nr:hypothetical protein [Candidatus Nitrosotalea sp. FS]NHH96946.1 hypothetical protein [Candidatus Nitrosotalea sp. FS]
MNLEWIVTGIILFGTMIAGGISLYIKRRKEQSVSIDNSDDLRI